jgi:precorrin-8X/cobalt-precorrin-8 methylmutase
MTIFDAYLMVDWSSNNSPKTGKDSIWYCLCTVRDGKIALHNSRNPGTRQRAISEIKTILFDLSKQNLMTLIGFDFPYGYPSGFATALRLTEISPWKALWKNLYDRIRDDYRNVNNRFKVASEFNRELTGSYGPYWGCPTAEETRHLSSTKNGRILPNGLSEYRITERLAAGAQPVWKLHYPGSVGSQALTGIPYLYALRFDHDLAPVSRTWPFETGLRAIESPKSEGWKILHAEIYPSIRTSPPMTGKVRDEIQVETLARYFAELDLRGDLAALFSGAPDLSEKDRRSVEMEEGWILGIPVRSMMIPGKLLKRKKAFC